MKNMVQFLVFKDEAVRVAAYDSLINLGGYAVFILPDVLNLLDVMVQAMVDKKDQNRDSVQAVAQALKLAGHLLRLKIERLNGSEGDES